MINPEDFIITRKRKRYKFAKFANAQNCFELEHWTALRRAAAQSKEVDCVEVGAGSGLFGVELAARYPDILFAAVDVKADRLQRGAYEALERGLDNIVFIRARADQLDQLFAPHSLQTIWLTFPDPFPRPRSARRRLTHPIYLRDYAQLIVDGSAPGKPVGESGVYLKHDNAAFFCWSLEQLVSEGWHINQLSFDLHDSALSDDYKILTTYERRWLSEGGVINFVQASPLGHPSKI